jgi:hypothetical protein
MTTELFMNKNVSKTDETLQDEFDFLSFTEGLITTLSTIDGEAPAFNRRSTNSVSPVIAAL